MFETASIYDISLILLWVIVLCMAVFGVIIPVIRVLTGTEKRWNIYENHKQ